MIQIYTFGTLQVIRDADSPNAHTVTEGDWHTRQARQLLKILLTERPQPVSTDRLIDILWPDSRPSAAATTLRSAINALRNVLEPNRRSRAPSSYIITKSPGYAFQNHTDIWLDVEEFETVLNHAEGIALSTERQAQLEAAVELYQDDYLTSDPYADWAQNERERLSERYLTALMTLADLYASANHYTAAIATCRRIITHDSMRENTYQALMRYQAESGDSASALLTYERCRIVLAEELGADPSPLTQAWHQRILNGEIGPQRIENGMDSIPTAQSSHQSIAGQPEEPTRTAPNPLILPPQTLSAQSFALNLSPAEPTYFVGRERELALLTARMRRAQSGQGSLFLIEGEAGVGKTHLVHHFLRQTITGQSTQLHPTQLHPTQLHPIPLHTTEGRLATGNFTIIHATCQPLEQQFPFAPLSDGLGRFLLSLPDNVLRTLPPTSLAQLAQLTPSLQDRLPELPVLPIEAWSNSDENRQRLINGLIAVLSTLAAARPLILFLDDLHWADAETLVLLGRLVQHLSQLPIFLLLAYRGADLDANQPLSTLLYTLHPTRHVPASMIDDDDNGSSPLSAQTTISAPTTMALVIQRFERYEVSTLASQLMTEPVTEETWLVTLLHTMTEGNPLFVTEALHTLQERRRNEPGLDWQQLFSSAHVGEPSQTDEILTADLESIVRLGQNPRVQEISLDRIHRLPPAPRNLLHLCAVIGRDFSLELLEQLAPTAPDTDLVTDLELLLHRKFLLERPDERIDFSHEIVRRVAYENMSMLQRRRLHRQVADALAALPRAQEIPGEIVFHYRQSGTGASQFVAQFSVLAGERLLHTYGFRQAVICFEEALALLNRDDAAAAKWVQRSLQGRGLAYESLFDPEGVTTTYRELQQWASERGDHPLLLMAYSRQASMLGLLGQQRESNELLQELIHTLTTADSGVFGDEVRRGRGTEVMLDLFERRQKIFLSSQPADTDGTWAAYLPPSPVVAEPVTAIMNALPSIHAVLPLLDYGWTLLVQGQLADAIHSLETAVDLAQQTDQPSIAVIAYHQLAVAARIRGDLEQCYALNEQSIAFHRRLHKQAGELVSMLPRIGSSFIALQMGALDEAEQRLTNVVDVLQRVESFRNHRNSATIGLGLVALTRGDIPKAENLLHAALSDTVHLYPYTHVQALLGLAQIADQRAEKLAARQYLQQALRFAGDRSLIEEYIETLLMIAQLAPEGAPTAMLIESMVTYVRDLGIVALADKLAQSQV